MIAPVRPDMSCADTSVPAAATRTPADPHGRVATLTLVITGLIFRSRPRPFGPVRTLPFGAHGRAEGTCNRRGRSGRLEPARHDVAIEITARTIARLRPGGRAVGEIAQAAATRGGIGSQSRWHGAAAAVAMASATAGTTTAPCQADLT